MSNECCLSLNAVKSTIFNFDHLIFFPAQVLDKLKEEFGDEYNEQNVMLSGTHTHSTPGGFLMDIAFDLNSFGFVKETFQAYVDGITRVCFIYSYFSFY